MKSFVGKSRAVAAGIAIATISGVLGGGWSSALGASAAAALTPKITSVAPNPFAPKNGATWFRVHVPATEFVSFLIRNESGQTIQGPHAPGLLVAANYRFQWDGKKNNARIASDGVYTIAVTASPESDTTKHFTATAKVRLDTTPPTLAHITGNGSTIYPFCSACGRTTFQPKVTVNESGRLWLVLSSGHEALVTAQPHASIGTFQLTWNGRNQEKQVVPEGAYKYFFTALDAAGNRATSPSYVVHVSYKGSP